MHFKEGDAIHNKVTKEEGRVVRVVEATDYNPPGYVVSITVDPRWGMRPIEAFWPKSQVEK